MLDYEEILNSSWDDLPKITVLPNGSWRLRLSNVVYQAGKGENSPSFLFVYSAKEPMEDVDEDELEALNVDGKMYDYEDNRIFTRFWTETKADLDTVRKHLVKHGVEPKGSISGTLKAAKGKEVIAYLNSRSFTNAAGEQQTENVATNFASVED